MRGENRTKPKGKKNQKTPQRKTKREGGGGVKKFEARCGRKRKKKGYIG
jgi:hypothetical protein